MTPPRNEYRFFLGGRDLEMVTIRGLFEQHVSGQFADKELTWGAKASAYKEEIVAALGKGQTVVLVELEDDLGLTEPGSPYAKKVKSIDHHNERAGFDRPTSIEQLFELLELPQTDWTRDLELIAANDRGHCRAMNNVHATRDEMEDIRRRDRLAQGITPEEEEEGRRAADAAVSWEDDRLTVVRLPHLRTATVTDVLDTHLGGPGYENLLVLCPDFTALFGPGRSVEALRLKFSDSFCGGELPHYGFWGLPRRMPDQETQLIAEFVRHDWTRPAAKIPVYGYRQILIWPLLLKESFKRHTDPDEDCGVATYADCRQADDQLQPWINLLTGKAYRVSRPWHEVSTLTEPPPPTDNFDVSPPVLGNDPTYEEIVYFHPFVRDFLFGDGTHDTNRAARPVRCLRREDVSAVEVRSNRETVRRLQVDRMELYLCKPKVAMLVVEVALSHDQPMMLNEALTLQSQFRQVYPPYFYKDYSSDSSVERGGNCPHQVTWIDHRGNPIVHSDFDVGRKDKEYAEFVHAGAEPPVSRHWRTLLEPLPRCKKNEPSGQSYQQIVDDRIPSMTYLAVDDPRAITEGDFDRMTFCDIGGSAPYPFASEFLASGRERHRYDRFWRRTPDEDGTDYELNTRYLNSGYQFVVVGRHGNCYYRRFIPSHFRRHYFRMGLIVHYSRAALLKFSEELSEAIKTLKDVRHDDEFKDPGFRSHVFHIQRTFLKFRNRSWFTEVSNQLQGSEMYQQWSEISRLGELFREVDESSQRLYEALAEYEARRLSRSQERLANTAQTLGVVGIILIIIDLLLSLR